MEILLVRHGRSEADSLNVHEGRADFELTEKGRRQVTALAAWLKENERFDVVYASPLKRAAETAETVAKASGVSVVYDEGLMEWDNGLLKGLSFEEAARRYPIPEGGRKPHHTCAETESLIAFRARAELFWSQLLERENADARILIAAHGGILTMLLRAMLSLPVNTAIGFGFSDTSVHKVQVENGAVRLVYLNRTSHLEGEDVGFGL